MPDNSQGVQQVPFFAVQELTPISNWRFIGKIDVIMFVFGCHLSLWNYKAKLNQSKLRAITLNLGRSRFYWVAGLLEIKSPGHSGNVKAVFDRRDDQVRSAPYVEFTHHIVVVTLNGVNAEVKIICHLFHNAARADKVQHV